MWKVLTGIMIIFSFNAFSLELDKIDGITEQGDCFRGPFATYNTWVDMLSKSPRFSKARFPFTENKFSHFKLSVTCLTFTYDVDGVAVDGFLLYPANIQKALPTIIYNRGGNTHYGRVVFGKMMYDLMPLAEKGFVVIGSQYRWSGERKKPENFIADGSEDQFGGVDVKDVLELVPIIKQLDIADSKRIGVYGESRGGMQSFLFAKAYQETKAIAVVAGISDVTMFRDRDDKTAFLLSKLIPDYNSKGDDALKSRSPVLWATDLPNAPSLLIHAKDDERVSFDHSVKMANALRLAEKPYEFVTYEMGGHDLSIHHEEIRDKIVAWFGSHL